jgi:hypothetical protein
MADFTRNSVADMAAGNRGINMGTTGSMHDTDRASDDLWGQDDAHWREHHATRPYVQADRGYEHYQPAYRYGHSAAHQHAGRDWDHVSGDLERGWDGARGDSKATWHEAKDAVRDAWDRVRGRR